MPLCASMGIGRWLTFLIDNMTPSDLKILEEIISEMKKVNISDEDCALWRAHCMESIDEWPQIRDAYLRVKDK
jgi:hypothetical protein